MYLHRGGWERAHARFWSCCLAPLVYRKPAVLSHPLNSRPRIRFWMVYPHTESHLMLSLTLQKPLWFYSRRKFKRQLPQEQKLQLTKSLEAPYPLNPSPSTRGWTHRWERGCCKRWRGHPHTSLSPSSTSRQYSVLSTLFHLFSLDSISLALH